jgi:DNA end-binding protein Ku
VKRKVAGKTIELPEEVPEESNVIDLMDALKQSLGRRKPAKAAKQPRDHRREAESARQHEDELCHCSYGSPFRR